MIADTSRVRLQKFLSQAGWSSRRKAEDLIRQGRVQVNGIPVTTLGTTIDPATDQVSVQGQPVHRPNKHVTYMLHKPPGLICSASEHQGQTVFSLLEGKISERLFTIGRLDKYSEGLLLLTNDGALAQQLAHPRHGHTKTYDVTINGPVSPQQLQTLRKPMMIDGYRTRAAHVTPLAQTRLPGTTTLRIILSEGRSRQIRNMCAQLELPIRQLRRIRIGSLALGQLKMGTFRRLSRAELAQVDIPDSEKLPPPPRQISAPRRATAATTSARHRANDPSAPRKRPESRAPRPCAHGATAIRPDARARARSVSPGNSTG